MHTPSISYTNTPSMSMTTLISKLFPLFVTSDKGVSSWSRQLIITRQANIIILISVIIAGAIVTLILRSRWRWRGSHSETTHDSLSLCNTTNTGVHLTQLIAESVKGSIHAHKLCHDGLKCHSTRWRQRSGGGWSDRSWRSCRLCLGLPRSKLGCALSNGSCLDGTHECEVGRLGIGYRKMAKELRDSQGKMSLSLVAVSL